MKKLISTIIILLAVSFCFAQNYTLEELIEIGLEKSYDIQSANVNVLYTKSSFRSSLYGLLPSLDLGFSSSKTYSTTIFDTLGNRYSYDTDWQESAGLSISKSFSLNEPSYYNIRNSVYDMKNSELAFDDARKNIAYYVFSYYLTVLEAQETLEIQKKNLQLQNKIHQQIQVQFDAGDKSLLELKQSEVSLIDYEIAVNEANNTLSSTRRDMFSYLNIQDAGYDFVEPEIEVNINDLEFVDNNELKQKANNIKISKLYNFQNLMNFLPTFTLSYNVANSDYDDVMAFSDYYRSNNSLSLSASWNIFNLLDNYESYSQSKRNLKLQELEYTLSQRTNEIEMTNLQNDLATIKRSYELYEEKLALSEENLNMAQEQFKLGMISLLELDDKKLEYQNTQLAKIQKYYQLLKKQEEINLLNSDLILGKW